MLDNNLGLSQKYEIHQPGQWLIRYSLTQWVEASLLEFPLVQINKYKGTFHPKTKSNFLTCSAFYPFRAFWCVCELSVLTALNSKRENNYL